MTYELAHTYLALRHFFAYRFLNFHLALEASIELLAEIQVKTEATATHLAVPCMKAALSLVLYATQKVYDSQTDYNYQYIIANLQQKLSEWIAVVLGSGEIKVKMPKPEIKVSEISFPYLNLH